MTVSMGYRSGNSSTTNGYASGGAPPYSGINVIDKFPFSSDDNATDIANLTGTRFGATGNLQV